MNDDATINEKGGKYAGMERYEARKAIVKDLEEQGYLVKLFRIHMQSEHTTDAVRQLSRSSNSSGS